MAGAACAFLSSWGMGFHESKAPPNDGEKPALQEKPAPQVSDDQSPKAAKVPPKLVIEGAARRSNAWRKQSVILETL